MHWWSQQNRGAMAPTPQAVGPSLIDLTSYRKKELIFHAWWGISRNQIPIGLFYKAPSSSNKHIMDTRT